MRLQAASGMRRNAKSRESTPENLMWNARSALIRLIELAPEQNDRWLTQACFTVDDPLKLSDNPSAHIFRNSSRLFVIWSDTAEKYVGSDI